MKPALPLALLLTAFFAGCFSSPASIADYPAGRDRDRSPEVADYTADGDSLEIMPRNQTGVWLASVDVRVIAGDVYLYPVNISSAGPKSVRVDLSGAKIPQDWRSHIYWIMNESASLFGTERILYRKKLEGIREKESSSPARPANR